MRLSHDLQAFARDLERVYTGMASLDSQVILTRSQDGGAVTAALGLDDSQINRLLLQIVQIGNDHGIRFPRELGMLLKQLLYFDRQAPAVCPVMPPWLGVRSQDQLVFHACALLCCTIAWKFAACKHIIGITPAVQRAGTPEFWHRSFQSWMTRGYS